MINPSFPISPSLTHLPSHEWKSSRANFLPSFCSGETMGRLRETGRQTQARWKLDGVALSVTHPPRVN